MKRAQSHVRDDIDARAARVVYAVACAALAAAGFYPVNNPDTFGHLAQGRQIAQLGHVPAYDTWSFFRSTPQPWHNYEWLSDLLTWKLFALGGPNALIAVKCVLLALAAALLLQLAQRLGGARAVIFAGALLVVAIPASRFRLTERPHVIALPFSALCFLGFSYLLGAYGQRVRRVELAWLAGLAALQTLWVNLHGSHLLGLLIGGLCCVLALGERASRGKVATAFALQLAASCVSPYGPQILTDAVAHVTDPAYRDLVSEWEPWKTTDPLWLLLSPILHTLLLIPCVPRLMRAGTAQRVLLAFTCLLGLASFRSIRFVAEFLLLGAPVIALGLAPTLRAISSRALGLALAGLALPCGALVAWGAALLPPLLPLAPGMLLARLPAASGHWLDQHARSPRVLAAMEDSWYLMYAAPRAHFLVDGRAPFYGPEHLRRMRAVFADRTARSEVLEGYRIDTVVVRHTHRAQRALLQHMLALPRFRVVSIEDRYATFVRDDLALREAGAPRALVALQPNYDPHWLTHADASQVQAILAELDSLPDEETSHGYQGFVRGMLALRTFQRAGKDNGLRPPHSDAERATLRKIQAWLARASSGADGVPIVDAYHGLVSTLLCDFDSAHEAFDLAGREGQSRETLLGAQELALRRGDADEVRAFLDQASAAPQAAGDGWLASLREELQSPPRCQ